jgi:hypothetical protein
MAAKEWPYDALQNDPLTECRIAVVDNAWPMGSYIVAFDLDHVDDAPNRPTEREVRQLQAFNAFYNRRYYSQYWIEKMADRPFDIDDGANGYIFRKWGDDDWGYRQRLWGRRGNTFWPGMPSQRAREGIPAKTLVEVLDRIHGDGSVRKQWEAWKQARPDVFGR